MEITVSSEYAIVFRIVANRMWERDAHKTKTNQMQKINLI